MPKLPSYLQQNKYGIFYFRAEWGQVLKYYIDASLLLIIRLTVE